MGDNELVDIRELLEYNKQVRYRYLQTISKISWRDLIKNREVSFNSIRNVFIHTLKAIDHWLDFLLKEHNFKNKQYDQYENIEEIYGYVDHIERRMEKYLDSLSTSKLNVKYALINDLDESVEVTVEDVLIHLFEEEVHHRGELIALFWQMNIKPPIMSWKYI